MSRPKSELDRIELLKELERALRMGSAQGIIMSHIIAERVGLNQTDLECMDILGLSGPVSAGKLAELTGLTTGAITGLVDRLEAAGYVKRERDPGDRRRVIIHLIEDKVMPRILPFYEPLAQQMNCLMEDYTDTEVELVLDFSARSNDVIKQHIDWLRERS